MTGFGSSADGRTTSRRDLRALVEEHFARDERERASRIRFLEELERLEEPCSESAGPVHVTASAVIVGERGTVLHLHRRLHRWMQPGGHIDRGEEPAEAALRESSEETGLALAHPPDGPRLIHLDVHRAAHGHTHLDLRFLLLGSSADPAPPPHESQEVRWFSWTEAEAMSDESLIGALRVASELRESIPLPAGGSGPGSVSDDG